MVGWWEGEGVVRWWEGEGVVGRGMVREWRVVMIMKGGCIHMYPLQLKFAH